MSGDRVLIRPLTNTEQAAIRRALAIARHVTWSGVEFKDTRVTTLRPEEVAASYRIELALCEGLVV